MLERDKIEIEHSGTGVFWVALALFVIWQDASNHWEMYYACEKFEQCEQFLEHMKD